MTCYDQVIYQPPLPGAWWKPLRPEPPLLPPEIWTEILIYATNVPFALDTDVVDPFEPGPKPPNLAKMHSALRYSLATKWAFILVCKLFHDIGLPFLYQSLLIVRWSSVKSLRNVLAQSSSKQGPSSNLGQWTRRFDFWTTLLFAEHIDDLAEIFRYMPRLEIVTAPGSCTRTGKRSALGYAIVEGWTVLS
jgi:hypothetical protein